MKETLEQFVYGVHLISDDDEYILEEANTPEILAFYQQYLDSKYETVSDFYADWVYKLFN